MRRGLAADSCSLDSHRDILPIITGTRLARIAHESRGGKAFKVHVDETTAVSNNAVAVKCSFTVMHASGQRSLSDYL